MDDGSTREIGRGHLRDAHDRSFAMYRYPPSPGCRQWLRVFWIPVWHVPPGEVREQRILTYPVCLLSITASYARLLGPRTTAARMPLSGAGWAFGVMLRPSAGRPLLQADIGSLTDKHADLAGVRLLADLVPAVRGIMETDPTSAGAHAAGRQLLEDRLPALGNPSGEAALADALVARVEEDPRITTVAALRAAFDLHERTLQRICTRFLGVSPRWMIRQRRLQEAGAQLRSGGSLSELAAGLGYADQAHFSRDFRAATGWTPGAFAALARDSR
ncbi:helix-turn-helix domain-containing protein [Arthrobacter sp. zg-Y895]|uniref:helix-turn-helix domain-containing protein n=1 Tax=Arthrobacter sp. zg-Y895 TaxID=2886933 RepID=UPI001D144990|nr:AraC family transcriptional regulator [Arthrobacter sp. zg-Y895]MCC3300276.1 AraC family transcriptional regulator [Arthrobacter sp. zg-Y895]